VVLAETNKAAKSVVEAFDSLKTRVILQEFIHEAGGADIRVIIVNGSIVGAMKRQGKEGEFRSNLHRGGKATMINLSREEKAVALKAAKAMGLAIAGVDMLQSNRGPMVLEVNSSPGLEGIEKSTGLDIAGRIVEYVETSVSRKRKPKDRVKA
jgi:ribosomal protein S6--L-glutamate ligase